MTTTEYKLREDRDCDNCGADTVRTVLTDWAFSRGYKDEEHDFPQQALCRYCYNVNNNRSEESIKMAQMFNELEKALKEKQ